MFQIVCIVINYLYVISQTYGQFWIFKKIVNKYVGKQAFTDIIGAQRSIEALQ